MNKKRFLLNIIAYFGLLSYSYYFYFYVFQYQKNRIGFTLNLDYIKLMESLVFIILLGYFYYRNDLNRSIYLTLSYILYVFIFVPSSVYYWMSEGARAYYYMQVSSFSIIDLIFILFNQKLKLFNSRCLSSFTIHSCDSARTNRWSFLLFAVIAVFFVADIFIYLSYGHSLSYLVHMDRVYGIRAVTRRTLPNKLFYVISWSSIAVVPAAIAWSIKARRYYLAVIPVFIQLLLFSIGGDKIYVFGLIFSVLMYLIYKHQMMDYFVILLNYGLAFVLIVKNVFLSSLVISRAFFEPMSLSYYYYNFFSKYPKMYLSSSIFKYFTSNPYKLDSPFVISKYIYRAPEMSANANYIANAYSNFGFGGIIVFTIILGFVLLLIENITSDKSMRPLVLMIVFFSFFELGNSALLTTLMNHGLIASICIAYLFVLSYRRGHREEPKP